MHTPIVWNRIEYNSMNKKFRKRMRELDRKSGVAIGTHERLFSIILPADKLKNDIIQEFMKYQENKDA